MSNERYTVEKVVGGFGSSKIHPLPLTLARTYVEHKQLREFIGLDKKVGFAIEFGCGYGRMLPILSEIALSVCGIERDVELSDIATDLSQSVIYNGKPWLTSFASESRDLALTFTFLQHLSEQECVLVVEEIQRLLKPGGVAIAVEETGDVFDDTTTGRTVGRYNELFHQCELVQFEPRKLEPVSRLENGGHYMKFIKR